jgi:hypothetical protein
VAFLKQTNDTSTGIEKLTFLRLIRPLKIISRPNGKHQKAGHGEICTGRGSPDAGRNVQVIGYYRRNAEWVENCVGRFGRTRQKIENFG